MFGGVIYGVFILFNFNCYFWFVVVVCFFGDRVMRIDLEIESIKLK